MSHRGWGVKKVPKKKCHVLFEWPLCHNSLWHILIIWGTARVTCTLSCNQYTKIWCHFTFIQIGNILFEENEGRKFGNSVSFDGFRFGGLDEGDVALGAVVVDRLHCLQKLLQFPGVRIICISKLERLIRSQSLMRNLFFKNSKLVWLLQFRS